MTKNRILIVEDSAALAALYCAHLSGAGFETERSDSAAGAGLALRAREFDGLLVDLGLPDGNGLDVLKDSRSLYPRIAAVVVTANASINKAVESIRDGAFEYLVKPVTREKLVAAMKAALLARKRPPPQAKPARPPGGIAGFVGASAAMQQVYTVVLSMAQSRASVFVTGESGTGKELCAEAIHKLGSRSGGPFIAINCGAIPKDLMESEIFGHVKGSFTGAVSDRDGAARLAHGGTLFLDEVCEMDFSLQPKLLRFLQTGMIQRVGTAVAERVDVRIVCATNRNPLAEVKAGRFREDLFYRLHVLPIAMPPLRARDRDVLELASHFLAEAALEEGKDFASIAPDAEAALLTSDWPGNVRQLQNAIRQAVVLHDGPRLEAWMLPASGRATSHTIELNVAGLDHAMGQHELWQVERAAIEGMIAKCGGSIPKAARQLGVSPSTIYRKRDSWAQMVAT